MASVPGQVEAGATPPIGLAVPLKSWPGVHIDQFRPAGGSTMSTEHHGRAAYSVVAS
jgi:hypothetical protein